MTTLQTPIKWQITQEREIQDILWLILRSYFPDVVDEDTLPRLGHSTYRADFGIVSLKLIIEAKYATSRDDFKKIEKEVQEDCVPYLRDLRYESIIVSSTTSPRAFRSMTRHAERY
jgi:REase_DpnII-MboI